MSAREEQKLLVEEQIKAKLALLPRFMEEFELKLSGQESNSFRTRLQYINHVTEFLNWLRKNKRYKIINIQELKRVRSTDIMEWKVSIEYVTKDDGKVYPASDKTIATKLSAVRQLFNCFADILEKNPTLSIKNPKIKHDGKEKIILDENEMDIIFDNVDNGVGTHRAISYQKNYITRDLAIIYILSGTGIRNDSLVGINISDLNLKNRTVNVTAKGNKKSTKNLNDETCFYLKEYLEERLQKELKTNALFISNRNERINKRTVRNMVKKYSGGIDKKVTPHVFRKTFGTRVYRETGDIGLVAEFLDHDDVNTTKKNYVVVDEEKMKKVTNEVNLSGNRIRQAY